MPKFDNAVYKLPTPSVTLVGGIVKLHLLHDIACYNWFFVTVKLRMLESGY